MVVEATPQTLEEWRQYVIENSLQILGEGSSRITYALDDKRALKLTKGEYHEGEFNQSDKENKFWTNASLRARQYLARIHEAGPDWSIMERAQDTIAKISYNTYPVPEILEKVMLDLQDALREEGHPVGDIYGPNVGYFGAGKFKVLDYGC